VAVSEAVRAYHAQFSEREWTRLENSADGQVEFAVTCRTLLQYLPSPARVLDLGGGPGRYTIWLAEQGYQITLADLSPELLAIARERIREADVGDHVEGVVEADARDLGAWPDGAFDAVLCLGPFYHLPDPTDRVRAAAELARVLTPGGVAFIALMPRLAFLRRMLALADERRRLFEPGFLARVLEDGAFSNDVPGRFTSGYGIRVAEIGPFFASFGFEQLALLSAESLTVGLEAVLPELLGDARLAEVVLGLALEAAADPSILGLARHLLYVGRRQRVPG
jgi:SAM-dependent methyltransferase